MGGVVQQINLYRGHESASAGSAGARRLLFTGIGAIVVVLVLAVAGEFYLSGLRADRAEVAQNLRKRRADMESFKATIVTPALDPFLQSELARLDEVKAGINANLVAIGKHGGLGTKGFSAYFGGLARNTLDGLWFRNVAVAAGGAEMLLSGQTTEPALVPRLLQTLSKEKAFTGRTFRKVSFERHEFEAGALVDFELRSAQSGEIDDAG